MNAPVCSDCSDTFQSAYNNSWSDNDNIAVALICTIVVALVLVNYAVKRRQDSSEVYSSRVSACYAVAACLIAFVVCILYQEPVRISHLLSMPIASVTRTPAFLSVEKYFPESRVLEAPSNFELAQREARAVLSARETIGYMRDSFSGANEYVGQDVKRDGRGWRFYLIKAGDHWSERALRECPFICSLLSPMHNVMNAALSILDPGVQIPAHYGYAKNLIRYHLAYVTPHQSPDRCYICVNGERYSWKEGEGVLFDDLFLHRVYNGTSEPRIVLFLDVHRPLGSMNSVVRSIETLVNHSDVIKAEVQRSEQQIATPLQVYE